jgi:hypothetical protein
MSFTLDSFAELEVIKVSLFSKWNVAVKSKSFDVMFNFFKKSFSSKNLDNEYLRIKQKAFESIKSDFFKAIDFFLEGASKKTAFKKET